MKSRLLRTILLILLILLALPAHADQDALRTAILGELAQKPVRAFRFVQEKQLAILSKPLVTEGELRLADQQTVIWDIRQPYQLRYEMNREQVRETGPQGERVLTVGQNPVAAALAQALSATLSGDWDEHTDLADVLASGEPGQWQLLIAPRAEALQALVDSIQVSGEHGVIRRIVITEKNGDTATIHLSPITP